jgi:hypothetical protein
MLIMHASIILYNTTITTYCQNDGNNNSNNNNKTVFVNVKHCLFSFILSSLVLSCLVSSCFIWLFVLSLSHSIIISGPLLLLLSCWRVLCLCLRACVRPGGREIMAFDVRCRYPPHPSQKKTSNPSQDLSLFLSLSLARSLISTHKTNNSHAHTHTHGCCSSDTYNGCRRRRRRRRKHNHQTKQPTNPTWTHHAYHFN